MAQGYRSKSTQEGVKEAGADAHECARIHPLYAITNQDIL